MLEKNDSLAAEAACEEDKDGTRLECWSRLCRVNGFSDLRKCISQPCAERIDVESFS
jgi:hypothetical protein